MGSNETVQPAARMRRIACSTSSAQLGESAGDAGDVQMAGREGSGSRRKSAGASALAAEPRRWYSTTGSTPSGARDLSMKPVRARGVDVTPAQSTPSVSSAGAHIAAEGVVAQPA